MKNKIIVWKVKIDKHFGSDVYLFNTYEHGKEFADVGHGVLWSESHFVDALPEDVDKMSKVMQLIRSKISSLPEINENVDESVFHGYSMLANYDLSTIERIVSCLVNKNVMNGRGVPTAEDYAKASGEWEGCTLEALYGNLAFTGRPF